MSETPKTINQSWLKRLKEESWEAELLISTVAIFGTLQLFKLIDWVTILAIDRLPPSEYMIGYMITFMGLLGVSILTTMFVVHFLLRAYWVGLVGLNSVFPDYSIEDSVFSEIYTRKILAVLPKLEKTIHDVDELSSVIFSAAFYMLVTYINMAVIALLVLCYYNLLVGHVPDIVLYFPLIVLALMQIASTITTILANLKKNKQNELIQNLYFHSVKWYSKVIYGPLYKYMMQINLTFSSNYKKKKSLIALIITVIFFGFCLTLFQFLDSKIPYLIRHDIMYGQTRTHSDFYASQSASETFLLAPQIDQDIIKSNIVKLFIPVLSHEENLYLDFCGPATEIKEDQPQWYLDCYSAYHDVFLNDQKVSTTFLKFRQPETDQFGIITYLDLRTAQWGSNIIRVKKNLKDGKEWEIPFQWVGEED